MRRFFKNHSILSNGTPLALSSPADSIIYPANDGSEPAKAGRNKYQRNGNGTMRLLKTLALTTMMGLGITAMSATSAEAQSIYFGFGNSGHGGYNRAYNGYHGSSYRHGGNWNGYRSGRTWHDTSHYDYHPGSYQRHGNHYHYQPGHYDFHRSGHWDHH